MLEQFPGIPLALNHVIEGIGFAQLTGMDQRHEQITNVSAVQGAIEQGVFLVQYSALQTALDDVIVVSAVAVLLDARNAGHYRVAVLFGAIGLCYNPLVPAFTFSGDWQHAVVSAS